MSGPGADGPAARTAAPDHDAEHEAEAERPAPGLGGLVRAHPWISAIMVACVVGGALAGPYLFDEDWSRLRQVAAGAFCGAWVGITLTVTKMIG